MKKIAFILCWGLLLLISCSDEEERDFGSISLSQLPTKSIQFVNEHFDGVEIQKATESMYRYKIALSDGHKIEFDPDGNWTYIDGESRKNKLPIPESLVKILPIGISEYMQEHHEGYFIYNVECVSKQNDNYFDISIYNVETKDENELTFKEDGSLFSGKIG